MADSLNYNFSTFYSAFSNGPVVESELIDNEDNMLRGTGLEYHLCSTTWWQLFKEHPRWRVVGNANEIVIEDGIIKIR